MFGQVISGQELIREIENQKTDASSKPYAEVRIMSCGELIQKSKGKTETPIQMLIKVALFQFLLLICVKH